MTWKLKMFWRAPWETGDEARDEYRAWLKDCEAWEGFQCSNISTRGNWTLIAWRYQ